MLLLLGPSLPQWLDVDLLNSDLLLSLFHFAENTKHTPEFYQSEVITLINYCSIHDLSHLQKCYNFYPLLSSSSVCDWTRHHLQYSLFILCERSYTSSIFIPIRKLSQTSS